jgi:hypothetical protein
MEVLPELEPPFRTTTGATHSTVPGRESDTHADRVRRNRRLVNTQNARSSEAMPPPGCAADRCIPGPAAAAWGVTGPAAAPTGMADPPITARWPP